MSTEIEEYQKSKEWRCCLGNKRNAWSITYPTLVEANAHNLHIILEGHIKKMTLLNYWSRDENVWLCDVLVNNPLVLYNKRNIIYRKNARGTHHGVGLIKTVSVTSLDYGNFQINHKMRYTVAKHDE